MYVFIRFTGVPAVAVDRRNYMGNIRTWHPCGMEKYCQLRGANGYITRWNPDKNN
jgi:hypothetical protein